MNALMLLTTQLPLQKDLWQAIQRWLWTLLTQPIQVGKTAILAETFVLSNLHPSDQVWNEEHRWTIRSLMVNRLTGDLAKKDCRHSLNQHRSLYQKTTLLSSWQKHTVDFWPTPCQWTTTIPGYKHRAQCTQYYQVPLPRLCTWPTDAFIQLTPYLLCIDPLINT